MVRRFQVLLATAVLAVALVCVARSGEPTKPVVKTESFDHDPGWDARANRVVPKSYPTVVQDFGYSATHFAGRAAGEMGGRVTRASEPAFYAERIGPRTLDDRLSASGTLALTQTTPGGGIFFGFFRAQQPGAGGGPFPRSGCTSTRSAAAAGWPRGSSPARTRAAARSSRRSSPASSAPLRSATTARAIAGHSTTIPMAPPGVAASPSP